VDKEKIQKEKAQEKILKTESKVLDKLDLPQPNFKVLFFLDENQASKRAFKKKACF